VWLVDLSVNRHSTAQTFWVIVNNCSEILSIEASDSAVGLGSDACRHWNTVHEVDLQVSQTSVY